MMTSMISLILLPIYTNYLTPSEYGTMTIVQTLVGMLQLFLFLSLHGAVTRFYFDFLEDKEKQKEYMGSIFLFVLIFSSLISVIFFVANKQIGSVLFNWNIWVFFTISFTNGLI